MQIMKLGLVLVTAFLAGIVCFSAGIASASWAAGRGDALSFAGALIGASLTVLIAFFFTQWEARATTYRARGGVIIALQLISRGTEFLLQQYDRIGDSEALEEDVIRGVNRRVRELLASIPEAESLLADPAFVASLPTVGAVTTVLTVRRALRNATPEFAAAEASRIAMRDNWFGIESTSAQISPRTLHELHELADAALARMRGYHHLGS